MTKTRIIKRYKSGASLQEIARMLGTARNTARKRLTEWGIAIRDPGHRGKGKPKTPEHRAKIALRRRERWQSLSQEEREHHRRRVSLARGGSGSSLRRTITTPDGRRILEHRYVAELDLGRRLAPYEDVHHIDGNPKNNDPENLIVLDHAEHTRVTVRGVRFCCPNCGHSFHRAEGRTSDEV